MSFWQPVEEPGTRPLRSRVFEFGCAIFAGVASLAHFALGQTAHPPPLSQAASPVVVVLTAAALPLRRVWPGPVFLYTVLAAVLAQWAAPGAPFPVALEIALYTVAATMSRATAPAAPALVVVWVFGAANAGRRTYNGRLLLPVMRAVPMRAWASGRMRRSGCRAAPGWRRLRLWRAIATSRSLEASAR